MVNELLVNLVDSVLGAGKRTARGNKAYGCPHCNHHKPKLEINFTQHKKGYNPWHCWACDKKGSRISQLFKQAKCQPEKFEELKKLIGSEVESKREIKVTSLKLPEEYKPILGSRDILARHAFTYLKSRGINKDDIEKYNIGYCEYGRYAKMIIIPSYDEVGDLNYFTGRSFEKDPFIKYRNPETSRDIVPFELFINWNIPLILCEGPFDAIAIKRNAIPLLGKNIQQNLMKKIITSTVEKIYIALDSDAMKQALRFVEYFINEGKEVYLVDLEGKDPSEMGFKNFTNLIQNTYPIDQYGLMKRKLQLV
jgi:DNA primase|tara:strand:+ start:1022 stop:1948 length:927 start_codon:yes stop_codon:yes gene_type:complete